MRSNVSNDIMRSTIIDFLFTYFFYSATILDINEDYPR